MKNLIKINLTDGSVKTYTAYFYHKQIKDVYEVLTDGMSCGLTTRDKLNLSKDYKVGQQLPKYIIKDLK